MISACTPSESLVASASLRAGSLSSFACLASRAVTLAWTLANRARSSTSSFSAARLLALASSTSCLIKPSSPCSLLTLSSAVWRSACSLTAAALAFSAVATAAAASASFAARSASLKTIFTCFAARPYCITSSCISSVSAGGSSSSCALASALADAASSTVAASSNSSKIGKSSSVSESRSSADGSVDISCRCASATTLPHVEFLKLPRTSHPTSHTQHRAHEIRTPKRQNPLFDEVCGETPRPVPFLEVVEQFHRN